jgi:hypothetical protein
MTDLEEMDDLVGSLPAPDPEHIKEGCLDCRSTQALSELLEFALGVAKLTAEAYAQGMEYRALDREITVDAEDLKALLITLKGGI